jgi:hypothetical protein
MKRFCSIRSAVTVVLAAAAITTFGCGGGGDDPPAIDAPAGCVASDAAAVIAENHVHSPHEVTVTSGEVSASAEKIYDIMGAATHTHSITVSAADFATLKGGGLVMITSTEGMLFGSNEPHTHVVTLSCQ